MKRSNSLPAKIIHKIEKNGDQVLIFLKLQSANFKTEYIDLKHDDAVSWKLAKLMEKLLFKLIQWHEISLFKKKQTDSQGCEVKRCQHYHKTLSPGTSPFGTANLQSWRQLSVNWSPKKVLLPSPYQLLWHS